MFTLALLLTVASTSASKVEALELNPQQVDEACVTFARKQCSRLRDRLRLSEREYWRKVIASLSQRTSDWPKFASAENSFREKRKRVALSSDWLKRCEEESKSLCAEFPADLQTGLLAEARVDPACTSRQQDALVPLKVLWVRAESFKGDRGRLPRSLKELKHKPKSRWYEIELLEPRGGQLVARAVGRGKMKGDVWTAVGGTMHAENDLCWRASMKKLNIKTAGSGQRR